MMMSGTSLLLAGVLLAPAGTPDVVRLDTASWMERISFEAYRPGQRPLGYELTLVEKAELNLPSGKHPVLRMHYTNRVAKNSFDLIQLPVIPGATTDQALRAVLRSNAFDIAVPMETGVTTYVHLRKGKTEVGFIGSIISGPSAMAVLEEMQPIQR